MSQQQLDTLLQMMKAQPILESTTVSSSAPGLSRWAPCFRSTLTSSANR